MKAFLMSLLALAVITIGANQLLVFGDFSSQAVSASGANVRISD